MPTPYNPSIDIQKQECRQEARLLRRQLPLDAISQGICQQLQNWALFHEAQHILFYMPLQDEINLLPLLTQVKNKHWHLPVIDSTLDLTQKPTDSLQRTNKMVFHRHISGQTFKQNRFGIQEPENRFEPLECSMTSDLLVLVPGLLFDRIGHRIGYGKGYYDRFLPCLEVGKNHHWAGIVPEALIHHEIPHDEWDFPMQFLVSENNIYPI